VALPIQAACLHVDWSVSFIFHLSQWFFTGGDECDRARQVECRRLVEARGRVTSKWRQKDRWLTRGHGWVVTWLTSARDRYHWHARFSPPAPTCRPAKYARHSVDYCHLPAGLKHPAIMPFRRTWSRVGASRPIRRVYLIQKFWGTCMQFTDPIQ